MNGAGTTTAVEGTQESQARDGGRTGMLRSDRAEPRAKARHLVIFSAPIVGCARSVVARS